MGLYINPTDCSKEEWLVRNKIGRASAITPATIPASEDEILVCLVDNGIFSAAALCLDDNERTAFAHPDGRMKLWMVVPRAAVRLLPGLAGV